MGNFFSTDGPLFEGMAYIINIIYVSVLWILFSIPIITIGASSTALYYTVTKVIRHGRSYIFREFWQSFKSNLKPKQVTAQHCRRQNNNQQQCFRQVPDGHQHTVCQNMSYILGKTCNIGQCINHHRRYHADTNNENKLQCL